MGVLGGQSPPNTPIFFFTPAIPREPIYLNLLWIKGV